jgi:DNA-3-methyladenine glycosylase I
MRKRCDWCGTDPLYCKYHDEEWGVPLYDEHKLFEFLTLESAQAGLSWITILRKRENYREAFYQFDPLKVARMNSSDVERLLLNAGIIRNRAKIEAAIHNAKAFLKIQESHGSFAQYSWQFVNGEPIVGRWSSLQEIPATTRESQLFAKDLKQKGFKFLGPTTVYAHMQASGMVNDHLLGCFKML